MKEKKAIALDMGGTNLRGALVDVHGNISNWHERTTPKDEDRTKILDGIFDVIDVLKKKSDAPIVGIGVGVTGLVSYNQGIVMASPNIRSWKDEPLKQEIEERFGIPTFIDNDSNLAGYGEAAFGAGKEASSLIMLTIGTGLGGGIILNEIGHMTIVPNGLLCNCGNYGCLEAYVSSTGILQRTRKFLNNGANSSLNDTSKYDPGNLSTLDICSEALQGDELSRQILDETGGYLGIGLSSLINILNPEVIVIGGRIADCRYDFIQKGVEEARRRTYGNEARMPLITKALLGDRAGILGAGKLVFDNVEH